MNVMQPDFSEKLDGMLFGSKKILCKVRGGITVWEKYMQSIQLGSNLRQIESKVIELNPKIDTLLQI